jgi:NAD(P)-dependent dehydrogenase (short-subunit alcohol dehydrogenase family)
MDAMVEGKPTRTARPQVSTQGQRRQWTRKLVTGGSAAIGEASARAVGADGTVLILAARRRDPLTRLGDELRARHAFLSQVHGGRMTIEPEAHEVSASRA